MSFSTLLRTANLLFQFFSIISLSTPANYLFAAAETTKSISAGARLLRLRDAITQQGFEIYTVEEYGDFSFIRVREHQVDYDFPVG